MYLKCSSDKVFFVSRLLLTFRISFDLSEGWWFSNPIKIKVANWLLLKAKDIKKILLCNPYLVHGICY